ncbi:hypothetical protein BKA81DRAFT_407055 [Phyllosticta paracitricarpa]
MRASIFITFLSAMVGANACALYMDCKCHDSTTGQQDDGTTQAACKYYNSNYAANYEYTPQLHHQASVSAPPPISPSVPQVCTVVKETSGPIDNCEWDSACKMAGGPNMYQYCWNKFPF